VKNRLILVDIDETVLNFTDPFEKWLVGRGWELKEKMRDVYDLTRLLNVNIDRALEVVHEFHTSEEAFTMLSPEPCAAVVLPKLYQDGYRFIAISAAVATQEVQDIRSENLKNAFGFEFDDVICTGLRGDKEHILSMHAPAIWVEDNFKHAVSGGQLGHRTFMITRGYNVGKDHPKVTRVADWHDIQKAL
jgi:hypothetical protein